MDPQVRVWIRFFVSAGALGAFAIVFLIIFLAEWNETTQPNPNLITLASTLTGLVSGVVASLMGIKISVRLKKKYESANPLFQKLVAIGDSLFPFWDEKAKATLSALYVVTYLVVGTTAIAIWATGENPVRPEIVDNLAGVTLGMVVAIVTAFMQPE
ncbi:MAG: hypothetical protein PVH89_09110 [Gammaproteobacteria bacterium]